MACEEAYVVPSQQWPAETHEARHELSAAVVGWQLVVQVSRLMKKNSRAPRAAAAADGGSNQGLQQGAVHEF